MSTSYKKNQIIVDRQKLAWTHNDSGAGFLYNINNNDFKRTIYDLDLAQGLIELLVENNFTLK